MNENDVAFTRQNKAGEIFVLYPAADSLTDRRDLCKWNLKNHLRKKPLPLILSLAKFQLRLIYGAVLKDALLPHLEKSIFFTQKKIVFAHSLILPLANFQRRLIYRVDLVASWLAWSRAPLLRPCQASYSFNSLPMWSYNNNVMT